MSLKWIITLHCKFFYILLPFSRETTKLIVYGQRGQTFVKLYSFTQIHSHVFRLQFLRFRERDSTRARISGTQNQGDGLPCLRYRRSLVDVKTRQFFRPLYEDKGQKIAIFNCEYLEDACFNWAETSWYVYLVHLEHISLELN